MKHLKRNPKTGRVEVWDEGEKVGEIITMGDQVQKKPEEKEK